MINNLGERMNDFDRQLQELTKIVQSSAIIQSKTVGEVAQQRYDIECLVQCLGSLNTSIDRLFVKLDATLLTLHKVATTNFNVAIQNAADSKMATANAVAVSEALVNILAVLAEADKLSNAKDFLRENQEKLLAEVTNNAKISQSEKARNEKEKADEAESQRRHEELDFAARRK